MRVLHLGTAYRPYVGGATIRLESVLVPLAQRPNMEVHLLVAMSPQRFGALPSYEVIDGVHVHRVNDQGKLLIASGRLQSQYQFELVHAHNARYGLFALVASRRPMILEFHSLRDLTGLKGKLTRYVCHRASHIFVLANSAAEQLIARFQLPPTKVETLYNGVKVESFDPERFQGAEIRRRLGITSQYVVGYAGTFHHWQGVHILVDAFSAVLAHCPDTTLLLVGDGPEVSALRSRVEGLGLADRVQFTGAVLPDQVSAHLAAMDVVAIVRPPTTETNSAVPLKVLEAMCMAKSVVVTPVLGLTEVIQHGQTGWITGDFLPGSIGNTIGEILTLSSTTRQRVERSARQYVLQTFSWSSTVDKMMACYRSVAGVS